MPAETLYDVLHDIEYRKKWDSNVIETFDIARLTVNADVGYYSCEQAQNETPTPSASIPTSHQVSSNSPSLWSLVLGCSGTCMRSPWACLRAVTDTHKHMNMQLCATCHILQGHIFKHI